MLYPIVETQRSLLKPLTMWAAGAANSFVDPYSPFAYVPGARCFAAGYELLYRLSKTYEKPGFDIREVEEDGRKIPVVEQIVLEKPFCRLLRFAQQAAPAGAIARPRQRRPVVLICAPLAGHHAVLLREMVETLLLNHEVYVTDWSDARDVPPADGPFHLDDYVAHVQEFIHYIGADNLHVLAVCQATVPVLAAISLLASAREPTPKSLILMGGPLDARCSATAVNLFPATQSLQWFQENLIHTVPDHYPGAGRKVYPSFLQQAGLAAMQPDRHASSHWGCYLDMVRGDVKCAEARQRSCQEYGALLDMAAEYYLSRSCFRNFVWPAVTGVCAVSQCVRRIFVPPRCSRSRVSWTTCPAAAKPKPHRTCAQALPRATSATSLRASAATTIFFRGHTGGPRFTPSSVT